MNPDIGSGDCRAYWTESLVRIVEPVLSSLAAGQLRARMPVEAVAGLENDRRAVSHLEAFARSLAGLGPWIAGGDSLSVDDEERVRMQTLARAALRSGTDPTSPDFFDFVSVKQALVDAAFLAQGLLRAGATFWGSLDLSVQQQTVACLRSTRVHEPYCNNWLLFSAMVEAFLFSVGEDWEQGRVDHALRQHESWYKGDGAYGDGPWFHWDYYNSFVIHPMLVDLLAVVGAQREEWQKMQSEVLRRARRFGAVQERMIAPDGSFPPLGRSITYRFGAFHALAQLALRRDLPTELKPAQVRCGLTAVLRRVLGSDGVFDESGWLTIGLSGHQPSLGERYISTGSLYLCTCVFLPLGLPKDDPFWSDPDCMWTAQHIWSGRDIACDHAMAES